MGHIVIGALLSGLFNLILTLLGTIVQVVMLPVNLLFQGVFPDFTSQINEVVQGFSMAMSQIGWVISIVPPIVKTTILFILTIEIALIVVLKSTKLTSKLWKILQKIKVW